MDVEVGSTYIDVAVAHNQYQTIRFAASRGVDLKGYTTLDVMASIRIPILTQACHPGKVETVKALIDGGCDVNKRYSFKRKGTVLQRGTLLDHLALTPCSDRAREVHAVLAAAGAKKYAEIKAARAAAGEDDDGDAGDGGDVAAATAGR